MSDTEDHSRLKLLFGVLAAIVMGYVGAGVLNLLRTPILGVMFCPGFEICRVYDGSPAADAGFELGDKILTVDGSPVEKVGPLGSGPASSGDVRAYEIDRAGEIIKLDVTFLDPPARIVYLRFGPTLVGLGFVMIGLYVYFRHPAQISATFLLLSLSTGWMLSNPPEVSGSYTRFLLGAVEVIAWFACASLWVYLSWIFPRRKRLIRNNPTLVTLLFTLSSAAAGALILALAYTVVLGLEVPRKILVLLDYLAGFVIIGYFALAAGSFIHGYFTTRPGRTKHYMRVVLVGSLLGLLPVALYSLMFAIDPHSELLLEGHVVLFTLLVPLALGFSILRVLAEDVTSEPR